MARPSKMQVQRRAAGSSRSTAKRLAVQANGQLGGRPREALPCIRCGIATTERDASRRACCATHK